MNRVLVAALLALGLVANAHADVMTPPGLLPGQQFRIVFVTTATTQATSSSISTYDTVVQNDVTATAPGLLTYNGSPVLYEAIGSTSTVNAISRLPADNVPIYLPDGTKVAAGGAALWNTTATPLLHPIDETAAKGAVNAATWTGTAPGGGVAGGGDGLGSSPNPAVGDTLFTSQNWVDIANGDATVTAPLYGFSSILTVPQATVVPEPGSITLMLVGIGGLLGHRLARRRRQAAARRQPSPPAHS